MSTKKALPLEATLRDLALLRASDVQLGNVLPQKQAGQTGDAALDESVGRATDFIKDARAVTRVDYKIEQAGGRLEGVRATLDEVASGLE